MRFAQLIVGPHGSGRSTYCSAISNHGTDRRRVIDVINLNPTADDADNGYEPLADIRDLIELDDVMEDVEMQMDNEGLAFCIKTLLENRDWLQEAVREADNDYILFDCPGQDDIHKHLPEIRQFIHLLHEFRFKICVVFIISAKFLMDETKFLSEIMAALSVMVNLKVPHVNILTKINLLTQSDRNQINNYLNSNPFDLLTKMTNANPNWQEKYEITESFEEVTHSLSRMRFHSLDIKDKQSIDSILVTVDSILEFSENDIKIMDCE